MVKTLLLNIVFITQKRLSELSKVVPEKCMFSLTLLLYLWSTLLEQICKAASKSCIQQLLLWSKQIALLCKDS